MSEGMRRQARQVAQHILSTRPAAPERAAEPELLPEPAADSLERMLAAPAGLPRGNSVATLQRAVGNQAVGRLLSMRGAATTATVTGGRSLRPITKRDDDAPVQRLNKPGAGWKVD